MRIYIFLWLVACIGLPLEVRAANEPCKDIDGEFLFFGDWVSLSEHSTDGPIGKLSIRNSQPRPQLTRQAFIHVPNLEAVAPVSVRIIFNEQNQKVELLENKQRESANSLAERKNIEQEFKCVNSKWRREYSFKGSTSDSGRVSVRKVVFLAPDGDGNLIATGNYETQTGFWSKSVVTIVWVAKFDHK
jgi:hypothetical protein